ncbi:MAG: amidohydrolase family protein [Acidobacteria bacterium]|nr:amidohydrolase family protein [Acidobacteriota bacterium]MCA1637958.1 amidohydrolase family protein [Acidobacteriota bacterium]
MFESNAQTSLPPQESYQFTNGHWFDGKNFRRQIFYSVHGILTGKKPAKVDEVVDLQNGYIIPPLAEAHNHWLEPQSVDEYIQNYLRDGVFYVKDQGNSPYLVSQFRDQVNRPTSVDYITALQGFTESGGHPNQIMLQFKGMGVFPKDWSEQDLNGKALMLINKESDIASHLALLLKDKPTFVKVFLLFSEQYEERKNNPKYLYKRGLNPKLLPEIIRLAHQSGLSVSAHISSAADFHNALIAGVDEISHLPLVDFEDGVSKEHFIISANDARLTAQRGVRVITTISWLSEMKSENPQQAEEALHQVVIPNLRVLKKYKVELLVGSDQFRQTPLGEIMLLSSTGVFTNLELLKMSCEVTPRAIFPKRKIGFLREGYEASFLVLGGNPLVNFEQIKNIRLRFKQGYLLGTPKQ